LKGKGKTKEQLRNELAESDRRIAELEAAVTESNRARQAIQEAQEYAESIVATVREPLVVLDADFRIILANRSFYQTFKVAPEETQGQLLYDMGNRQWDIPRLRELLEKLLPENTAFENFEVEHDFPPIGRRVMLLNARRIYREANKTQMVLLAIEDVTERKQAEARNQHLNTMLRTLRNVNQLITHERDSQRLIQKSCELLVETGGYNVALMLLIDENRNFISAAEAGGFPSEEVWSEFLERLKNGDYPRCFSEALKRDKPFTILELGADECKDCDCALACVSDTAFIDRLEYEGKVYGAVLARISPEFAQKEEEQDLFHELVGDMAFALTIIEKEKERKRAEEEGRKFKTISDNAKHGTSITSLEGEFIYVNTAYAQMHGYTPDELIGKPFSIVYSEEQLKVAEGLRDRILQIGTHFTEEIWRTKKDGTVFPTLTTSTVVKDSTGKQLYIASTLMDITERKKMEEQLIVTDRLASIGELSSGIAHELNNPLTSVIGFSDLLLGKKNLPDDVKEDLRVVNREAKRTAGVVRNLLIFARKHEVEKKPVDIHSIIKLVLELRAYEQRIQNIKVHTRFASSLPEIIADGFQLQQVFLNIIINAEHFMVEEHGRGTLTITTERAGDIIRASFADDGPGIAKENLGHLFAPFFTTKEVGKGTGLGLSISYGIITEHGGRIYAESELGKGATFVVELPISQ